jgi:hypothetical protein
MFVYQYLGGREEGPRGPAPTPTTLGPIPPPPVAPGGGWSGGPKNPSTGGGPQG